MREVIAHSIQSVKVETIATPEFFEKRIQLYVASPQEFWEIVNREAKKLAMRFYGRKEDRSNG